MQMFIPSNKDQGILFWLLLKCFVVAAANFEINPISDVYNWHYPKKIRK